MAYVLVTTTKRNKIQISSASITSKTNAAMPDVCRSVLMREIRVCWLRVGNVMEPNPGRGWKQKSLMCAPANKAVGSHFT